MKTWLLLLYVYSASTGGDLQKVHSAIDLTSKSVCLEAAKSINRGTKQIRAECKYVSPVSRISKL